VISLEAVALVCIVTRWSGSGWIEAYLSSRLASFSALTLLVCKAVSKMTYKVSSGTLSLLVADDAGFPYNKLLTRTLYLQVLDYDRFTRDDPIGEVCLPLSDISLAKEQTFWRTLQPCKGHTVSAI